jgi:hypothetical protein
MEPEDRVLEMKRLETIRNKTMQAEGGRASLMYGGDPGFAFEYGGSWADWHDQHRNTMPVEQYIQTKLPKARLPFREMEEGGIAQLSRPGYFFGGPAAGKKALKAIMDAWRANKHWGVGGPPYKPEATSFNIREMTKKNLGQEFSLKELKEISESPFARSTKQPKFEEFSQEFKNIKASIIKEKLQESKRHAEAMINSAKMVPADNPTAKKVQAQFTRDGKKQLEEANEGLKEIDIYMGMLQKKGRTVHQSGGLAYMLGEPTYMKYGAGGSVGHAPWHKPTGHAQPTPHMDTPTPNVATRPDPLKAPRGLPSVAPKNMDPAYMQQQMMQRAMMGQGNTGQGPRPMANAGGRIGFAEGPSKEDFKKQLLRKRFHELMRQWEDYQRNYEWEEKRGQPQEAAEGGIMRMGFKKGGDMSRRGFMKLIAGLAALPVVGKYFKAAKLAKPAAAVTETIIKSNAPGMPIWFPKLVERVLKEGKDVTGKAGIAERQTVHSVKLPESGTELTMMRDLTTDDVVVDIGFGKHGWGAGRHGQPAQLILKKGEWIEPDVTKAGKVKGKGVKTKDEFIVEEAEFTGGHPENIKFEESVAERYGDHASDFTEIEKYAVGKNTDKKIVGKKARSDTEAERYAESRAEGQLEDIDPDDFAKGGLAYLLGE